VATDDFSSDNITNTVTNTTASTTVNTAVEMMIARLCVSNQLADVGSKELASISVDGLSISSSMMTKTFEKGKIKTSCQWQRISCELCGRVEMCPVFPHSDSITLSAASLI
jgi:hypothetical protein